MIIMHMMMRCDDNDVHDDDDDYVDYDAHDDEM